MNKRYVHKLNSSGAFEIEKILRLTHFCGREDIKADSNILGNKAENIDRYEGQKY